MLILSRKKGQKTTLKVPPEFMRQLVEKAETLSIDVIVAEIGGHRTRIAFNAPPEVKIMREEYDGPKKDA